MITVQQIEALIDAGCSAEQVLAGVKAGLPDAQVREARKREQHRLRQKAYLARKRLNADTAPEAEVAVTAVAVVAEEKVCDANDANDASQVTDEAAKERSPTPPKENKYIPPKSPRGGDEEAFERFWDLYPRKMNRPKAWRAFNRALKIVDVPELMAGLERAMPGWDDPAYVPYPAAWLTNHGWNDPVHAKPRQKPRQKARPSRRARGGVVMLDMTPERKAAAIKSYLSTGTWNTSWGKRPTMAEIEAVSGWP